MKLWIQLALSIFLPTTLFAQEVIRYFGDQTVLQPGAHLPVYNLDQNGKFATLNGDTLYTWDDNTGELLETEKRSTPLFINKPSYLESEDANIVAHSNNKDHFYLYNRETGEPIANHRFDNQTITAIRIACFNDKLVVQTDDHIPYVASEIDLPPNFPLPDNLMETGTYHHLIDAKTGAILRSFHSIRQVQMNFFGDRDSQNLFAIERYQGMGTSFTSPDGTFTTSSSINYTSAFYGLDRDSGSYLFTPIRNEDSSVFNGLIKLDWESGEILALISPNKIHRIDTESLSVSEFQISTELKTNSSSQILNLTTHENSVTAFIGEVQNSISNRFVRSWDNESFELLSTIDALDNQNTNSIQNYTPIDSTTVALANNEGLIEIWNIIDGSYIRSLPSLESGISAWHTSPDGSMLFMRTFKLPRTSNSEQHIVWDLVNDKEVYHKNESLDSPSRGLATFTQDSQKLITYNEFNQITAYDLIKENVAYTLSTPFSKVISSAYYENGEKHYSVHKNGLVSKSDRNGNASTFQLPDTDITPYQTEQKSDLFLYYADDKIKSYSPTNDSIETVWDTSEIGKPDKALITSDSTRLILFWESFNTIFSELENLIQDAKNGYNTLPSFNSIDSIQEFLDDFENANLHNLPIGTSGDESSFSKNFKKVIENAEVFERSPFENESTEPHTATPPSNGNRINTHFQSIEESFNQFNNSIFYPVVSNTRTLIIDLTNATEIADIRTPDINDIYLSPDGKQLALKPKNNSRVIFEPNFLFPQDPQTQTVQTFDTIEGKLNIEIELPLTSSVNGLTFSHDSQSILIHKDQTLQKYDASNGSLLNESNLPTILGFSFTPPATSLTASSDGKLLAVQSSLSGLRIYQLDSFSEIGLENIFTFNSADTPSLTFSFASPRPAFLNVDFFGNIREFNYETGTVVHSTLDNSDPQKRSIVPQIKPDTRYSLLLSNNLQDWEYSSFDLTPTNKLKRFPFRFNEDGSNFGKTIEFSLSEDN